MTRRTHRSTKTEHSGAKQGGSGFYGHHADAKEECKVARRKNDKIEIEDQLVDKSRCSICGSVYHATRESDSAMYCICCDKFY